MASEREITLENYSRKAKVLAIFLWVSRKRKQLCLAELYEIFYAQILHRYVYCRSKWPSAEFVVLQRDRVTILMIEKVEKVFLYIWQLVCPSVLEQIAFPQNNGRIFCMFIRTDVKSHVILGLLVTSTNICGFLLAQFLTLWLIIISFISMFVWMVILLMLA